MVRNSKSEFFFKIPVPLEKILLIVLILLLRMIFRDASQLTMPEVKRVLLVGLNISIKGRINNTESQEKIRPLLQLTFYLLDKLRRFTLSKEVKNVIIYTVILTDEQ